MIKSLEVVAVNVVAVLTVMTKGARVTAPRRGAARHVASPDTPSLGQRLGLWFNRALVLAGVAAVLFAGLHGGRYLLSLEVERIAVTGKLDNVSVASIEALVAPQLASGFLAADLDDIRATLEAMPWIYIANVRRRWPNTLDIEVVEQRPIARWGERGFLNHEGERFVVQQSPRWHPLPQLSGPDGSEAALVRRYQNLESLLRGIGREVVRLTLDDVGQYSAELDTGIQVKFGADHFVSRARRFVGLYSKQLANAQVASVDLRYEHGAAVVFKPQDQIAMIDQQAVRGGQ